MNSIIFEVDCGCLVPHREYKFLKPTNNMKYYKETPWFKTYLHSSPQSRTESWQVRSLQQLNARLYYVELPVESYYIRFIFKDLTEELYLMLLGITEEVKLALSWIEKDHQLNWRDRLYCRLKEPGLPGREKFKIPWD